MVIEIIEPGIQTLDDYYSFVNGRVNRLKRKSSNCFETGLYCVGEVGEDRDMGEEEPNDILNNLREIKNPQKGGLVGWECRMKVLAPYHSHLAIISQVDPVLVTHRMGPFAPISHSQPIGEVNRRYLNENSSVRYLVPKLLEKILDLK